MVFSNFQFAIAGWITDKNTKANTQIGLLSEAVCDSSSLLQFVAGVPFYQDSVLYAFKMYQCHIVTNRTTIHLEFHERSLEANEVGTQMRFLRVICSSNWINDSSFS